MKIVPFLIVTATLILSCVTASSPDAGNGTSTAANNTLRPIPLQVCTNPSECTIVCPILIKTEAQTVAVASCRCGGKFRYSRMCYTEEVRAKALNDCAGCTEDSECSTTCEAGVCKECVSKATLLSTAPCFPTCTGEEEEGEECISPDLTPFSGKCVSTSWIENNGHSSGIFRKLGNSPVLCIPSFPCGTAGHMVRVCDGAQVCELKTYAKVCEARNDCTENVMPVSQLKHSYDWSRVSTSTCASSGTLYLTSVSKDPDASEYSISAIVAFIGDTLNRSGLGLITDVLVTIPDLVRAGISMTQK